MNRTTALEELYIRNSKKNEKRRDPEQKTKK
jgi:hypothetical protein